LYGNVNLIYIYNVIAIILTAKNEFEKLVTLEQEIYIVSALIFFQGTKRYTHALYYYFLLFSCLLVAVVQQIRKPKDIPLDCKECQDAISVTYNDVKLNVARDRFKKLTCDPFMQVNKECRNWYFVHFQIVNNLF